MPYLKIRFCSNNAGKGSLSLVAYYCRHHISPLSAAFSTIVSTITHYSSLWLLCKYIDSFTAEKDVYWAIYLE